jgi:hypothetical protein
MRELRTAALVLSLTACAASSVAVKTPPVSELAGCYVKAETDEGSRLLLRLRPNGNYVAFSIAGLGIWGKATGTWSVDDEGLFFGPSNETRDWHHYMHAIHVSRSGGRLMLVDGSDKFIKSHSSDCGL